MPFEAAKCIANAQVIWTMNVESDEEKWKSRGCGGAM